MFGGLFSALGSAASGIGSGINSAVSTIGSGLGSLFGGFGGSGAAAGANPAPAAFEVTAQTNNAGGALPPLQERTIAPPPAVIDSVPMAANAGQPGRGSAMVGEMPQQPGFLDRVREFLPSEQQFARFQRAQSGMNQFQQQMAPQAPAMPAPMAAPQPMGAPIMPSAAGMAPGMASMQAASVGPQGIPATMQSAAARQLEDALRQRLAARRPGMAGGLMTRMG